MKRIAIILILCITALVPASLRGQENSEFTSEQLALRNDLFNFLRVEGFMPELDSDGEIKFKAEGELFYITVSNNDENPMYVVISASYTYPDDYSVETVLMATKELNLYKGVKVMCYDESFSIRTEMYVRNSEPVKAAFYKSIEMINYVVENFIEECEKVGSVSTSSSSIAEIPFIITKMEVANADGNGNIIQDYGASIWDFKTKYLKPRITVKPYRNTGTYTVYVKLYRDGSLVKGTSSPKDYSYSQPIVISGRSSQVITLSGYGSNNAGHWTAGDYRFEIWYNGYCIGSKAFKVI